MITNDEFKKLEKIIELAVDGAIDRRGLITKDDLKYLPTKDEFYERMDQLAGMMQKVLEAQDMITERNSEQDDQLEKLDKRVKKTERVLNIS